MLNRPIPFHGPFTSARTVEGSKGKGRKEEDVTVLVIMQSLDTSLPIKSYVTLLLNGPLTFPEMDLTHHIRIFC